MTPVSVVGQGRRAPVCPVCGLETEDPIPGCPVLLHYCHPRPSGSRYVLFLLRDLSELDAEAAVRAVDEARDLIARGGCEEDVHRAVDQWRTAALRDVGLGDFADACGRIEEAVGFWYS